MRDKLCVYKLMLAKHAKKPIRLITVAKLLPKICSLSQGMEVLSNSALPMKEG